MNSVLANNAESKVLEFWTVLSFLFSEHAFDIFSLFRKRKVEFQQGKIYFQVSESLYDEPNISVFQLSIVYAEKQMLSSFPVWNFKPLRPFC